jgi:uncharacterized membrane protein
MPIVFIVVMLIMLTIVRQMFWGQSPSGWCGSSRPRDTESSRDPSLEILRRRFAAGEITEQEYEEKRKLLLT